MGGKDGVPNSSDWDGPGSYETIGIDTTLWIGLRAMVHLTH